MAAIDIAFMLELPEEDIDICLIHLVENGSISQDGDLYDLNRSFTASEAAKLDELHAQFKQLRPVLANIVAHLNSGGLVIRSDAALNRRSIGRSETRANDWRKSTSPAPWMLIPQMQSTQRRYHEDVDAISRLSRRIR